MSKKNKSLLNLLFSFDQIKSDIHKNKEIYKEIRDENLKEGFNETFEEAVDRLGLSEHDLLLKSESLKKTSRLFYFISFSFIIINIMLTALNGFNIFQNALIIPVISIYMFLLGFRFSLNKFQIEERNLKCLKEFVKKPKKWIV